MCLLKPGQSNALCCHKECRSYYMLSNQECLHQTHLIHAKPQEVDESSPNQTLTTGYSPDKSSVSSTKISPTNLKRHLGFESDDLEATLNKKKIKSDERKSSEEDMIPPLLGLGQAQANMKGQAQTNFGIPALDTGSVFYKNNIISQLNCESLLNNKLSLLSNLQKLQLGSSLYDPTSALLANTPFGLNHAHLQTNPLANKLHNDNISQVLSNIKEYNSPSSNLEEQLRSFQNKTIDFISNQHKLIADLSQKTDLIQDTLSCLISEVSSLKGLVREPEQSQGQGQIIQQQMTQTLTSQPAVSTQTCSSEELAAFLNGSNTQFEYQLVLDGDFALPLYRERNFEIAVKLVDNAGNLIENSNKLAVAISLYTCENPPKYIDSNTSGNKILKGPIEKTLVKGSAAFEKIQIKEVSSHFRNGWIFLVVQPKLVNSNVSSNSQEKGDNSIDISKIRPLVVERVVIKAKKSKEK